jgi:hypothetical protein
MDLLAALVCGGVSLGLGLLSCRALATCDLQLFMFDVGRLDALLGHWSDVVGSVYASVCCLLSIAALRILTARGQRPALAVPIAVLARTIHECAGGSRRGLDSQGVSRLRGILRVFPKERNSLWIRESSETPCNS